MPASRVTFVQTCDLVARDAPWPFADQHAAEIDAHWARRAAENPAYFNGRIYMLASHAIRNGALTGQLIPVDFKAFLYWRETGQRDTSVCDVFGSAIIRSHDGAILLGRQRAGNLNAGLVYLPGGFIDARDVDGAGEVDIRASVLREVEEETGLAARTLAVSEGFLVTTVGQQVSVAVEFVADGEAKHVLAAMRRTLAGDAASELEEIVAVRDVDDLDGLPMPIYADALLRYLLGARPAPR